MRAFLFAIGAVCFGVWSYACAAGDETTTSTSSTNAAATNTSASTTTTATGSGSGGVNGTGGNGTGGDGGGGSAMGGAGGMGPCVSCNDAYGACIVNNACPPESQLCSGGAIASYQALKNCMCDYCDAECPATCNNMGMDTPDCGTCVGNNVPVVCNPEQAACVVN